MKKERWLQYTEIESLHDRRCLLFLIKVAGDRFSLLASPDHDREQGVLQGAEVGLARKETTGSLQGGSDWILKETGNARRHIKQRCPWLKRSGGWGRLRASSGWQWLHSGSGKVIRRPKKGVAKPVAKYTGAGTCCLCAVSFLVIQSSDPAALQR